MNTQQKTIITDEVINKAIIYFENQRKQKNLISSILIAGIIAICFIVFAITTESIEMKCMRAIQTMELSLDGSEIYTAASNYHNNKCNF